MTGTWTSMTMTNRPRSRYHSEAVSLYVRLRVKGEGQLYYRKERLGTALGGTNAQVMASTTEWFPARVSYKGV